MESNTDVLDYTYRIVLFLFICVPTRLFIAHLPELFYKKKMLKMLTITGLILSCIGICFLYLYFGNYRLNAPEGGGYTWWHSLRILHGLVYTFTGIVCIFISIYSDNYNKSYLTNSLMYIKYLMIFDVTVGLFSFLHDKIKI